jgi:flagellar protein FliL
MVDKADKTKAQDDEGNKSGKSPSTVRIILFSVVLSVLLGSAMVGATMYFMNSADNEHRASTAVEGEEEDAGDTEALETKVDPDAPPQYLSMAPKFVVSFNDQKNARFMQFTLQVMTRDDETIKLLSKHMPAIRSSLILLVGSQEYEKISTRDGKEALLADITADINRTLENIAGLSTVEAAYFDSFVIQ